MTSLRRSSLLWLSLLLGFVGIAAMVVAYRLAKTEAAEFLDGQQQQIALNAGDGVRQRRLGGSDLDREDEFSVTIRDASGKIVRNSLSDVLIPLQSRQGFANVSVSGQLWRVYMSTDGARTVQVAQRTEVRDELARDAALGVAAPLFILIPLSWIVVGWAMDRVLKRLDALAREVAKRSGSADRTLPLEGIPTEVAPLVTAVNSLILRLQAAIGQQKQFLADAAHELRTPLAAIQIQAEALERAPLQAVEERRIAIVAGVRRASGLVDQLLRLARLDEAPSPPSLGAIEVASLLLDCVSDYIETAQEKGVDLGIIEQAEVTVRGFKGELRILLENLIDNAVRYTERGGTVDIVLKREGELAVIDIVDSGIGIPSGAGQHIFDRFFRAAPSDIDGTGLGLSIVRRIAERNGYTVSVENRTDHQPGVRARVVLPHSHG